MVKGLRDQVSGRRGATVATTVLSGKTAQLAFLGEHLTTGPWRLGAVQKTPP
jgi:hypothetical protein